MLTNLTNLTLEQFWTLPEGETAYELIDGQAIPKVSPKYFHSSLQRALLRLFDAWCPGNGRIRPEWSVILERNGSPWVPTPDLTYISYARLPRSWRRNEACPIPCDLAIEIISPDQTFKQLADKALDYIKAGVLRVWVIDPETFSITVFSPDGVSKQLSGDTKIVDTLLPGLELTPKVIFEEAELL